MRRILLLISLLLAVGVACDRPANDADRAAGKGDAGPAAARAPAAYERRMLFLARSQDRPVGALFDFTTFDDQARLHRAVRARRGQGGRGWDSLCVAAWAGEPVPVPRLIVPHGPFRLLVRDG